MQNKAMTADLAQFKMTFLKQINFHYKTLTEVSVIHCSDKQ